MITTTTKSIYIVMTVIDGIEDDEVDQYQEVIGVYDSMAQAEDLVNKLNNRMPIVGIDYAYLNQYREAVIVSFDLNSHVIHGA